MKNTAYQYSAITLNLIEDNVLAPRILAIAGTNMFVGTAHKGRCFGYLLASIQKPAKILIRLRLRPGAQCIAPNTG